jgi:hypothetical protein
MLPAHACVAIQIVGAYAAPGEITALRQRCDSILGAEQCRVVSGAGLGDDACWRSTVTVGVRVGVATVVLAAGDRNNARQTRRDLSFQDRDQLPERWATLGLVIAALVTIEEHTAAAAPEPRPADSGVARPATEGQRHEALMVALAADGGRAAPAAGPASRWLGGGRLNAMLAGLAAAGSLPGVAFGVGLELSVLWAHAGALARAAYFPLGPRATVPVTTGTGGGRFGMWSAGFGVCGRARADRMLSLRACAGGDFSVTAADGFGVAETATTRALSEAIWGAVGAQLHVSPRITVVAEPEVRVAAQRSGFAILGAGTVFTPSRVGGRVALGVAVRF